MALATRFRLTQKHDEDINDITKNLPSLQFESALSEDEKKLIILRPIKHALTVTHCALTTVMVDVFNKARKVLFSILNQDKQGRHNTEIGNDDRDPLIVGIIGYGRLGRQIVNCLLTYGQLHPTRLQISTRRPGNLDLQNKGVECYFNNRRLVSAVHVIILCVLPSQMSCVAEEIKDCVSSSQVVISLCSSLTARKLCQILRSSNIISPVLHRSGEHPDVKYDYSLDVITALENKETVLHTCPIGVQKTAPGVMVSSDDRLAETLILAVVNMCSEHGLSQEQILTIIHTAVFGDSAKKPLSDRLVPGDLGIAEILEDNKRCFPFFNLVDVFGNGSALSKVLLENESLQRAFTSRYCHVFDDYIHKSKYGHI